MPNVARDAGDERADRDATGKRATRRPGPARDAGHAADLPERRWFSRLMQALNRAYARVYHRLDVLAPCKLPRSGAAIIVCNHTSGLDPNLIQVCCPRLITWMMAKEYFDLPVLKYMFKELGVIAVSRSGRDTAAMREAMRALKNGQLLGLFPEGKIETSRELLPFQTGVAMMAMKTGVPVYPAYLDGTQRQTEMVPALLRPQRARIIFGDEVRFDRSDDSRESLDAATAAIRAAVEGLRQRMDPAAAGRGS